MKLKDGFILRTVAGETVVIPTGKDIDLNVMITLNETGKFLWQKLENDVDEAELVASLLSEYDVDEPTANKHVAMFVKELNDHGFIR